MQTKLFLLFNILLCKLCVAQEYVDSIVPKHDKVFACHITYLSNDNIFYQYGVNKFTFIERKNVLSFILNSRDAVQLNEQSAQDAKDFHLSNEELYQKGHDDAMRFYRPEAGTDVLIVSLISPLLGLVPAIACSSTQPKEKNLNYHNSELIKSADYRNGYTHQAHLIKKHKVWLNWGIAFGVNLSLAAIIISSAKKR